MLDGLSAVLLLRQDFNCKDGAIPQSIVITLYPFYIP